MQASSRAPSGFELCLDACVFLFLPVLAVGSRGVAFLAAAAGVFALGVLAREGEANWRRLRVPALILAALLIWGLASTLWTIQPRRGLLIAMRLVGLFAIGLTLAAAAERLAAPRRTFACLVAGLALGLALTALQHLTRGDLTSALYLRPFRNSILNQVENGFVLLLPPVLATLALCGRRAAAGIVAAATVAVICLLVGTAGKVALAIAAAAAVAIYFGRRQIACVAAAASVAVILTAPLTFPRLIEVPTVQQRAISYKMSVEHRLQIWSFVGARIAEHPLRGWGLDSSRAIPGGSDLTPQGVPYLPLHPHNAGLQVWLELGLPGAALLALLAAWFWARFAVAPWPRLYAAAVGGSLTAAMTVALGSYGVWQEWWIGAECLTVFVILVMARVAREAAPADTGG